MKSQKNRLFIQAKFTLFCGTALSLLAFLGCKGSPIEPAPGFAFPSPAVKTQAEQVFDDQAFQDCQSIGNSECVDLTGHYADAENQANLDSTLQIIQPDCKDVRLVFAGGDKTLTLSPNGVVQKIDESSEQIARWQGSCLIQTFTMSGTIKRTVFRLDNFGNIKTTIDQLESNGTKHHWESTYTRSS